MKVFPNSCDESHKVAGQVARPNDRVDLVLPLKPLYHGRQLAARFAVPSVHDTLPFVQSFVARFLLLGYWVRVSMES